MNSQAIYLKFLQSEGIATDSRQNVTNKIFFSLSGESFDGNDFALQAIQNGAKAAIVSRKTLCTDHRFIYSANPLNTLQQLASFHRSKVDASIIGITGSNGKTTTKELLFKVLSEKYKCFATKGNLNNHIGVPLSLLSLTNEEIAIIEMGANHPGEIKTLAEIARPDFGIITNIGKAHLEGFGSFEGVKETKSELYRFIESVNGCLFINGANPILLELSENLRLTRFFYLHGEPLLCNGKVLSSNPFLKAELHFPSGKKIVLQTQLAGEYNLENVMAAAAIGFHFGVDEELIAKAISEYAPLNNRSQFKVSPNNQLIIDAYNANPSSMISAIDNLAAQNASQKMAILGDMLELGKYEVEEHEAVLEKLLTIENLSAVLVGKTFSALGRKYGFLCFGNTDDAYEHFRKIPVSKHLILLKGSRGIKLEKLIELF